MIYSIDTILWVFVVDDAILRSGSSVVDVFTSVRVLTIPSSIHHIKTWLLLIKFSPRQKFWNLFLVVYFGEKSTLGDALTCDAGP